MIHNRQTKSEIAQNWSIVRKLCSTGDTYVLPGFGAINDTPPKEIYNLPLVLAYAVLDRVLNVLRDQGEFSCKSWMLGAKMDASQNKLPWKDYCLVDKGRGARNELAHEAKLLNKADCLHFIDAIESELRAWSIV